MFLDQEAAYIVSGSAAAVMQMSDRVQVRPYILTLKPYARLSRHPEKARIQSRRLGLGGQDLLWHKRW